MEINLNKKPTVKPENGDIITFENEPYYSYLLIYDLENACYGLLNLQKSEIESSGEVEELLAEIGGLYTVYPSGTFKIVSK